MISGISKMFTFYGSWLPVFIMKYFNTYKKNMESSQKLILCSYLNVLELQKFDIFGPIRPPYFCIIFWHLLPKTLRMINRFLGVFSWNNSGQPIILTKWEIISKSYWNQKYFSKSHLWCAWTRNVVESWYCWQIRLWNSHGLLVFMENPFFEL